jgi:hypothetical protein
METRFKKMLSVLKNIIKPLSQEQKVFEDILLEIAEINESPAMYRLEDEGDYCIIVLSLSLDSIKQFIAHYSQNELSDLMINIADAPENVKKIAEARSALIVENVSTSVIIMRMEVLQEKIFPQVINYLRENPKKLDEYDRRSYLARRTLYDLDMLFKEKKTNVNTSLSDSIFATMQKHLHLAFFLIQLNNENAIFPSLALLNIVCGYLHLGISTLKTHTQNEINRLITYRGIFSENPKDRHSLNISLKSSNQSAKMMVDYFNQFYPQSAFVVPDEKKQMHHPIFKTVTVQCRTVMHPDMIAELKNDETVDLYRKNVFAFKLNECIEQFNTMYKVLTETKLICQSDSFAAIKKSVSHLVDHLKNQGFNDQQTINKDCTDIEILFKKLQFLKPISASMSAFFPSEMATFRDDSINILRDLKELSTRYHSLKALNISI